jgi:rieske iron-sulfur protein
MARSADGILAYSALCAHAGCPVSGWVKLIVAGKFIGSVMPEIGGGYLPSPE